MDKHTPVLLGEAVAALNVKAGGRYVDCTLGFGGHAREILNRGGRVLALDVDERGFNEVRKQITDNREQNADDGGRKTDNLIFRKENFGKLGQVLEEVGWGKVDGVLYDLGMSSWQIDNSGRGFSFGQDAPLDMRLDERLGVTAADLLNALGEKDIYEIFKNFGEEPRSRQLARAVAHARSLKKIETTTDLRQALGTDDVKVLARLWQALRIVVNGELDSLARSLPQAGEALKSGGRLVVISFQSLEDRIVKNFGRTSILVRTVGEVVGPSFEELKVNKRSKSAKMRVFERL